ncbi:sensor histidine kinase [Paenibacillus sp. strain BS8-2]
MKLRTYLLLANCISIAVIIVLLFVFFQYMLVTKQQLIWLGAATIGAGVLSAGLHFLLVRPLEAGVRRMRDGAAQVSSGKLDARVADSGLTEFKELAEQFNVMGANLERSFAQIKAAEKAQRELVANIAHDLRTPLASIQSYAEAIEDGVTRDDESFRQYIATIRSESIRLGELIQDVFEFSTLDASNHAGDRLDSWDSKMKSNIGFGIEQIEGVYVDQLLVELLSRFTPQLSAKKVQINVKMPEQALQVNMTSRALLRVLQNLIENAIRYSPNGGMIVVQAAKLKDGWIRVSVSDEGPGIPEEERENVFERFYRIDRARRREGGGTGLGLSIAKLLVQQHGGQIGVEQPPTGHGSLFWFTVRGA